MPGFFRPVIDLISGLFLSRLTDSTSVPGSYRWIFRLPRWNPDTSTRNHQILILTRIALYSDRQNCTRMAAMNEDTFRDNIENPCHRSVLPDATLSGTLRNPACGDEVTLYLKIDGDVIVEAWHQVRGCLLCKASASVLCEHLDKMHVTDAKLISHDKMIQLIGISVTPVRTQCCTLPILTLHNVLTSFESPNAAN